MTHADEFESTVAETKALIEDLAQRLAWHDREKVYRALIGSLHALRDSLPWDEAVRVGACLPALLRGHYYEGWHPTSPSLSIKSREAFLERIHASVHRDPGIDSELVARALFALLAERMPEADLEEARALTPKPLHALWPQ